MIFLHLTHKLKHIGGDGVMKKGTYNTFSAF